MRIGCCGDLKAAQAVKDAGFEFLEVGVQGVLKGQLSDAEWAQTAPDPARFPLPVEAANGLVPGTLPIVGPHRDFAALTCYMANVARRAQRLGLQRLVFGSGAARRRPEGVDPAQALHEITEFTRMAGEACARHEVVLVIEHLHAQETNTLNKLSQTRALADAVNLPSVAVLVDSYHYVLEKETDAAILNLGPRLQHVHIAEPGGRVNPGAHGPFQPGAGAGKAFDFVSFFCLLRKTGYDQRISFEGSWARPIDQAGRSTVAYIRQAWDEAGRCE